MGDPFEDFYDEIENLESAVSKFIHPRELGERWDGTWAYFAFSYERAFQELARKAYEDGVRSSYLIEPLFFLARHSIELSLKATIADFAKISDNAPQLLGHKLLDLWDELYRQWSAMVHRRTMTGVSSADNLFLTSTRSTPKVVVIATHPIEEASSLKART